MRLHFVVEGQTEETFVRDLLASELGAKKIFCDAHRVTTGRRRAKVYRGGLVSYQHLRRDLDLWMREDSGPDSWFTTMLDLYRLPADFPGIDECRGVADPIRKVELLEKGFASDLDNIRFVPYIQLHEFEALLFSDPGSFSIAFPSNKKELAALEAIGRAFKTPEHIDEGEDSSPSRRIHRLFPQYGKVSAGPLVAKHIGLTKLRAKCPHFDGWIERLQQAGGAG